MCSVAKLVLFLMNYYIILCICLNALQGALCLRNVRIVAPEAIERGGAVHMRCDYDLETDALYSVKWYRGDREFFRYCPRDVPPTKVFRIPGIEVEEFDSNAKKLIFNATSRIADGRYTCEVSADSPSFQTSQVHTNLYVIDAPKIGPVIHGIKHRYRAGSKLKAECVIRSSFPAANLSFFINNKPANVQHRRVEVLEDKLLNSYSSIHMAIHKDSFINKKIKIRCTASIYSIYIQSVEKSAEEERIRTAPEYLPDVDEIVVHPIHRLQESGGGVLQTETNSQTMLLGILITLCLHSF